MISMTVAFTSQVIWESRSLVTIRGRFRIVSIPVFYRYHQIFKVYRHYAHIWREEIAKISIPPKAGGRNGAKKCSLWPEQFVFRRSRKTLGRCGIGRCRRRLEFMQPSSSFPKGKK